MRKAKRAYKYRFYPTDEQRNILAQTFGCVRFVYNWGLHTSSIAYKERSEKLFYSHLSALLPDLKKEYPWLAEVSSVPVQQSLRHLEKAFKNFFAGRAKYPHFKKRQSSQSATYASNAFTLEGTTLTLAKMDASLDIHWHRALPGNVKPSSMTLTKDCANRYFVSILVEEQIKALPVVNAMVGLDLGLKSMVILSTGEAVGNPRFFQQDEKRLAKAQRRHAKKKKGSQNRNKARIKVARVHARIHDRRRDYQHKLSTRIVHENQVLPFRQMTEGRRDSGVSDGIRRTLCVESLAVKNMVKNHCLAKAISDVGWGELVRQLAYKSEWYGRTLIKIDRWYPSSKTCHDCKHIVELLPLDVREWVCPECGTWHERDSNAAQNILTEGLSVNACGGSVRPVRAKVRQATPVEAGSSQPQG